MGIDLTTSVGEVALANPLMTASGTCGTGVELMRAVDITKLGAMGGPGAVVMKTVTSEPRAGNAPVRIAETPSGMLNAIGLENPGIAHFIEKNLPKARELGVPLVASVAGRSVSEYAECVEKLTEAGGIEAIELNLSCPNDKSGGAGKSPLAFGQDPKAGGEVVGACRELTGLPLWAKLTAMSSNLTEMAKEAEVRGADGITAINTLSGMSIDINRRAPVISVGGGGLSGPAIRPVAVNAVYRIVGAVGIPVVGCGGITTAEDVVEFLMAGARAVQIGTATFGNPTLWNTLSAELSELLGKLGASSVEEIIGAART